MEPPPLTETQLAREIALFEDLLENLREDRPQQQWARKQLQRLIQEEESELMLLRHSP